MKKTIVLSFLCYLLNSASADCDVRPYSTKLIPACDANDLRIRWPNHENQTTYYSCLAVHNAVLVSCGTNEVFTYVLQKCKPCADYLPPVECERLPTQNPPNCVPIGENTESSTAASPTTSSGLPTPHYPTNPPEPTTTDPPGEETTLEDGATLDPNTENPATETTDGSTDSNTNSTVTGPVTPCPSSPTIAPPPEVTTNNPDVPQPPTPDPTPPSVELTPPQQGFKGSLH